MKCRKLGVIETRFAELIWSHAPVFVVELEALCRQEFEWKKPATHMMLERLCAQGLFQNTDGMVGVLLSCEEFSALQSEQAVVQRPKFALRPFISACPLAFGETGVKGRIQSVLNYKKPAFWMILIALIVCTAVAVGFLTEPVAANQEVSGSPGFYFDIDQDGIEEKIDCIWGGSGIIQFWVGIYEPGERLPKYDSSYNLGAGLRPSLFVAENGKAYVLLKDSDGRIAHWLEIRIEHEELNLYENGERWRNIRVSTFEHYLFNSAYGISMDLYWQKQTQIHAVYDSSRPRYMLGEDKMLYACERNDRGDYIAVRITGVMEQITLTEENFDSLISEDYWLASGIDAVSAREDNVATWQGTNVSGMSYYVMLQANGNVLLCSVGSEMHRIIWLNPVGDADDFYAYIDSMNAD